ncbi:MAG TPA: winged helix-turn-helix domain-containing protein [Allosphingosinicella sp.]
MEVHPPTRQVIRNGKSETLEPRVMQVLVALARANGAILTRDELIERCWGGRIVGENAIHRVISRVRDIASNLGNDSFQLETITKVGYRMVVDGAPPPSLAIPGQAGEGQRQDVGRRLVVGGAVAAIVAGAAALYFRNAAPSAHAPSAEALELYRRGVQAQRQGLPDQRKQVIAYFEQAVEADPLYSDAWGALALAYLHVLQSSPGTEGPRAEQMRSAARRALALDPDNADAQAALVLIRPWYRDWARSERDLRRLLARYPDHWLLRFHLAVILYEVGRWEEGIQHNRKLLDSDSFLPMATSFLVFALWSGGRLREADSLVDSALERWPQYQLLWDTKYELLAFSGRSAAAIAFVNDPDKWIAGSDTAAVSSRIVLARAIGTRDPGAVAAALSAQRAMLIEQAGSAPVVAPVFAALGRADLAFEALEAYFREGPVAAGQEQPRYTQFLFTPPMAPLRADPRFGAITRAIGLEDYWRSARIPPDYRRG